MNKTRPAPVFAGKLFFVLIASLPLILVVIRYFKWETYGIFDFHVFHLAGLLANEGRIDQIYNPDIFIGKILEVYGKPALLSWLYPPLLLPYGQLLALMPVAEAYLVSGFFFTAVFYTAVRWAFPRNSREIIILSTLPLIIAFRFGQPVPLILILLIIAYRVENRSLWGGLLVLAFAAAKPQIGGVVLFVLFLRRLPRSLLPSIFIGAGFLLAFASLYGWNIWALSLQNIALAASYIESGIMNPRWVASVYAGLLAIGAPGPVAAAGQAIVLITFAATAAWLFREEKRQQIWMVAAIAMIFTSPYLMYYDLVFLLLPIGIVVSGMDARSGRNQIYTIFLLEVLMVVLVDQGTSSSYNFLFFCSVLAVLLFIKYRQNKARTSAQAAKIAAQRRA